MPRFRSKPVIIEAIQWTGHNIEAVLEFVTTAGWHGRSGDIIWVMTAHNYRIGCRPGDWIVPDSAPYTFRPIKPDAMLLTHDRLAD